MKTLYNIYESLLDDEDVLMANADKTVVQVYLDQLNAIVLQQNHWRGGNWVKIEDSTLMLGDNDVHVTFTLNKEGAKIIEQINKLTPINTIKCHYIKFYDGQLLDGEIIKKYTAWKVEFIRSRNVSNVTFDLTLWSSNLHFGMARLVSEFDKLTFKNCHIILPGKDLGDSLKFGEIPVFNNCKVEGCYMIFIYDPSLFLEKETVEGIEKIIDPTYTYEVWDNKKQDMIVRKANAKTLWATVHNQKRYDIIETGLRKGNPVMPYKVRDNAKVKDFIDVTQFDNLLHYISIRDNNCRMILYNKSNDTRHWRKYNHKKYYNSQIPSDPDWMVAVYDEKDARL